MTSICLSAPSCSIDARTVVGAVRNSRPMSICAARPGWQWRTTVSTRTGSPSTRIRTACTELSGGQIAACDQHAGAGHVEHRGSLGKFENAPQCAKHVEPFMPRRSVLGVFISENAPIRHATKQATGQHQFTRFPEGIERSTILSRTICPSSAADLWCSRRWTSLLDLASNRTPCITKEIANSPFDIESRACTYASFVIDD